MANLSLRAIVPYELIGPNPHRNFDVNPIDDNGPEIAAMQQSMKKYGNWENVVVRPKNNCINGKEVTQKELEEYLRERGYVCDFEVELWHGHKRTRAAVLMNQNPEKFEKLPDPNLQIRVIDDDAMHKGMIEENKSTWGHNMATMVEDTYSVYTRLNDQIARFDNVKEYNEAGYMYIKDPAVFTKAKEAKHVGHNIIKAYAPDASDDEIHASLAVIKAVKAGYLKMTDAYRATNANNLRFSLAVIEAVQNALIPKLIKDLWTKEILDIFKDPEKVPPISQWKAAKRFFTANLSSDEEKLMNPVTYLTNNRVQEVKPVSHYIFKFIELKELTNLDQVYKEVGDGLKGFEKEAKEALELYLNKLKKAAEKKRKEEEAKKLAEKIAAKKAADPNYDPDNDPDLKGDGEETESKGEGEDDEETESKGDTVAIKRKKMEAAVSAANTLVYNAPQIIANLEETTTLSPDLPEDQENLDDLITTLSTRICSLVEKWKGKEALGEMLFDLVESFDIPMGDPTDVILGLDDETPDPDPEEVEASKPADKPAKDKASGGKKAMVKKTTGKK